MTHHEDSQAGKLELLIIKHRHVTGKSRFTGTAATVTNHHGALPSHGPTLHDDASGAARGPGRVKLTPSRTHELHNGAACRSKKPMNFSIRNQ